MKSTVTSKGQTTILKALRGQLHLNPGAELSWTVGDGRQRVVRLARPAENSFAAFLGSFPLPQGQSVADVMAQVRGAREPLLQAGPERQAVSVLDFLAADPARP